MDKFIDVLINNNLAALVIDGVATPEQLAQNWSNVFFEYCDLVDATEMKLKAKLLAKYTIQKKRYDLAKGLLIILEFNPNESIAKSIVELGFDVEYNGINDLHKFIARVKALMVSENLRLEIKENELNDFVNKSANTESIEAKYFQLIFVRLSKYMGYALKFESTTVAEYAAILNMYTNEIENKKELLK